MNAVRLAVRLRSGSKRDELNRTQAQGSSKARRETGNYLNVIRVIGKSEQNIHNYSVFIAISWLRLISAQSRSSHLSVGTSWLAATSWPKCIPGSATESSGYSCWLVDWVTGIFFVTQVILQSYRNLNTTAHSISTLIPVGAIPLIHLTHYVYILMRTSVHIHVDRIHRIDHVRDRDTCHSGCIIISLNTCVLDSICKYL